MTTIKIVEVGPRDGLQNEASLLDVATKTALVDNLSAAGLNHIEAGSFVSPKWVPQMADSARVFERIQRRPGTRYTALTPNQRGLEAAIACGVDEVAVFTAASEGFSQKNINCSIAESLKRFEPVIETARAEGLPVRAYLSCIVACPYDGDTDPIQVAALSEKLLMMGCYEVSLGDTIGVGTPADIQQVLRALKGIPPAHLALHLHDTYGQALANVLLALDYDISCFDAAVAGLGGCPYAKGASGNVATEDLAYMLKGLGLNTGIDLPALIEVGHAICTQLQRPNQSKVGNALGRALDTASSCASSQESAS